MIDQDEKIKDLYNKLLTYTSDLERIRNFIPYLQSMHTQSYLYRKTCKKLRLLVIDTSDYVKVFSAVEECKYSIECPRVKINARELFDATHHEVLDLAYLACHCSARFYD